MAFKQTDPAACKELLSNGAPYLDVRTPEEFESGHYKGARNIPLLVMDAGTMVKNGAFVESVEAEFKDKTAPIVVSCKVGKRGAMACDALTAAGYTNLTNMEGGYDAWTSAGL
jgi:rhodanese-related sulfurtransferase